MNRRTIVQTSLAAGLVTGMVALGLSEVEARSSLRFGLLRTTSEAEVDDLAQRVVALVTALRARRR